jgi:hypothetical protein
MQDFITLTPCKVGDYVYDTYGYYNVVRIVDVVNDFALFEGIELSKDEYRDRMIEKIIYH